MAGTPEPELPDPVPTTPDAVTPDLPPPDEEAPDIRPRSEQSSGSEPNEAAEDDTAVEPREDAEAPGEGRPPAGPGTPAPQEQTD
ncbi:hypothetical protein ACFYOG_04870 [Streptomyces sp. NPDC007818]|uniref:hypothetical protein n=1 Tax=Streptomyces sp. NPDC007818 TaxID=3364780 RepID=UPI0036CBBA53